mmetsp:Transcript_32944/g.60557  ORF Transcript_32944/g.60557 Transcript_32944/m.60557 type:complete len:152 (-) Transcript_32944:171-626(-)
MLAPKPDSAQTKSVLWTAPTPRRSMAAKTSYHVQNSCFVQQLQRSILGPLRLTDSEGHLLPARCFSGWALAHLLGTTGNSLLQVPKAGSGHELTESVREVRAVQGVIRAQSVSVPPDALLQRVEALLLRVPACVCETEHRKGAICGLSRDA